MDFIGALFIVYIECSKAYEQVQAASFTWHSLPGTYIQWTLSVIGVALKQSVLCSLFHSFALLLAATAAAAPSLHRAFGKKPRLHRQSISESTPAETLAAELTS